MSTKKASYLHKTTYTNKLTFSVLILLLFWRMVIQQGKVSDVAEIAQVCIVYGLISIAIWANKDNLKCINIDKNFIVAFVVVGGVYSFVFSVKFGLFLWFFTFINFWFLISGKLEFEHVPYSRITSLYIFIMLLPLFLKVLVKQTVVLPSDRAFFEAIFTPNLMLIIFEEAIFRGLLWMFLVGENFKEYQIIFVQGTLFWLSHLYYFKSSPVTFWIWLPFSSIMLGVIVWRAKTISPSIVTHFLYNFLVALTR